MTTIKVKDLEKNSDISTEEMKQLKGGGKQKQGAQFDSLVYESEMKDDKIDPTKPKDFVADAPPDR